MFTGCAGNTVNHYAAQQPAMDIQAYFDGPIQAWGLIQDWRGRVVNRFDVSMQGQWEGDTGTLKEDFIFYDGKKQQRIWTIKKIAHQDYVGSAGDILDTAIGKAKGNAIQWKYRMDLPVGDKVYRLTFDDWMWLMNDGVLINRSYIKKFGVTVAELTLFMKKMPSDAQ